MKEQENLELAELMHIAEEKLNEEIIEQFILAYNPEGLGTSRIQRFTYAKLKAGEEGMAELEASKSEAMQVAYEEACSEFIIRHNPQRIGATRKQMLAIALLNAARAAAAKDVAA